jgi:hypothetical protein
MLVFNQKQWSITIQRPKIKDKSYLLAKCVEGLVHKKELTLTLLKWKVIGLCHQYRARPACTSMQSD